MIPSLPGALRWRWALLACLVAAAWGAAPGFGQDALPRAPMAHPAVGEVACAHCHESPHGDAEVETCDSCHTPDDWRPSTFDLTRHAQTAFPLHGAHQEVACGLCHVDAALVGLPSDCASCHVDRHRGILGDDCASCHTPEAFAPVPDFDHAATGFVLTGAHAASECADCHEGERGAALARTAPPAGCATCHTPSHGDLGDDCALCHDPAGGDFASAAAGAFDHRATGFPLSRRHATLSCGSCHPADAPAPLARCSSCHTDPHAGQLGTACQDCHREDRWQLARFDHDQTGWPLRGRHFVTPCAQCHTNQRWIGLSDECWDCHALDAGRANATSGVPHPFGRLDCAECHSVWSF